MYLSLFLRSYGLLLSLLALALWLAVRYFEHPTWRRGALLALCMSVMFYYHYTSLLAFVALGLYTLFAHPRRLWRWWLPGVLLLAAIVPHVLAKWSVFTGRTSFYRTITLPPLPDAGLRLIKTMVGPTLLWFAILFGLATLLIVVRKSLQLRGFGVILWIGSPIALYLLQSRLGLFQDPRYMWWVLPGLALWLGWGLS